MQKDHFGSLCGVSQQLINRAWLFHPFEWEVRVQLSVEEGRCQAEVWDICDLGASSWVFGASGESKVFFKPLAKDGISNWAYMCSVASVLQQYPQCGALLDNSRMQFGLKQRWVMGDNISLMLWMRDWCTGRRWLLLNHRRAKVGNVSSDSWEISARHSRNDWRTECFVMI